MSEKEKFIPTYYLHIIDDTIIGSGCAKVIKKDGIDVTNLETTQEIAKAWREYKLVDGQPVKSTQKIIAIKSQKVRAVRNSYLVKYVDTKQLFLVWNSLTDAEKADYTSYRTYLLDYTKLPKWYERSPNTLEEWKLEHSRLVTKTNVI